jgi:hypothetical protein
MGGWQDISFRNRANLIRILNERYMSGSLTLGEISTLLALETPALQREVFLMLPLQDREDHMYLVEVKPKPPPTPKELYMGGHISIQEYEDLINPGTCVQPGSGIHLSEWRKGLCLWAVWERIGTTAVQSIMQCSLVVYEKIL